METIEFAEVCTDCANAVHGSSPQDAARALIKGGAFVSGDLDTVCADLDRYREAGVDEVVLNVTGAGATARTDVRVYPTRAGAPPLVSNLNPAPGRTTAAQVVVPVGADGSISLRNNAGRVDLVVDLLQKFRTSILLLGFQEFLGLVPFEHERSQSLLPLDELDELCAGAFHDVSRVELLYFVLLLLGLLLEAANLFFHDLLIRQGRLRGGYCAHVGGVVVGEGGVAARASFYRCLLRWQGRPRTTTTSAGFSS